LKAVRKSGFSLGEVLAAVLIMSLCLIPVLLLFSKTRTETTRGVHRLRVMELINEAIDWVSICPFGKLESLAGFGSGEIIAIPLGVPDNKCLQPFISEGSGETYSKDYEGPIKRIIKINDIDNGRLKEAEIAIDWSEGGGNFCYRMSVLVWDEDFPDY
jgi:hypothetical protein